MTERKNCFIMQVLIKETDEELYKFLQFISTNKPESEFTKEIFERVETTKINEKIQE